MMNVDETTEEGKKSMEELAKKYHETSIALNGMVDSAAEAALFMKQGASDTDKAVLDLIHTVKQGESSIQGVFNATREQMGAVVENLNATRDIYAKMIDDTRLKIKELRDLRNAAFSSGNLSDGGAYNTQIDTMEAEIKEYEAVIKAIDEKNKAAEGEIQQINESIDAYEKQATVLKENKDLTEEQARSLEKALGDALDIVLGKTQNFQETVKKVANIYRTAKEAAEKFGGGIGNVAEAAETATRAQTLLHGASLKLGTALVRMGMSASAAKAALAMIPGALGVAAISAAIVVITKLIRKHREAKAAAEEAKEKQREYYEEVGKGAAPAIAKFEELRAKYADLRTEMEKQEFIEENKKALDDLGVSINTVNDADQLLINGVEEYVRAQIQYAQADLYRAQAQEKIARAAALRIQIEEAEKSGETQQVVSDEYDQWGHKKMKVVSKAELLRDELTTLTDEITQDYNKATSITRSADNLIQNITSTNSQQVNESLQQTIDNAKREWKRYERDVKDIRANASKYTEAELKAAEENEAKWKKKYESLTGKSTSSGGKASKTTTDREAEKRNTAIESFNKQIQAMIRSVEGDIEREEISAIESNTEAMSRQLDLEKRVLVEKAEDIGKAMTDLFAGNVDLLNRKTIEASKLTEKGWEDAGEGIATVFSSGYGAYDAHGKMHELLITPILPNGEVLSAEEVQNYVDNVLQGSQNFLDADEKGIVIAIDLDQDAGEQLHEMQEAYYALMELIGKYDALKRQNIEKQRSEREEQSLNAYLQQYGTYEERKLAITQDYERRIKDAENKGTQGEVLTLKRQMDDALKELDNSFDQRYHLIFANAEALSDNLLAQAIEATGDAIEREKNSGNIEALTQLYARLREQMGVQRDRSRGWGFAGIVEGFGLRDRAADTRSTADALEETLTIKEAGLEIMKTLNLDQDEIERTRNEINELRAAINAMREDAVLLDEQARDTFIKGFTEVTTVFAQLGSEMQSFRNGEGKTLDTIADIGSALSGLASHAGEIQKAFEGGFSGKENRAAAIATAISGTIELISMVGKSIANNKKAQEEWNRTVEESEHRYKMLLLDKMDYEQSNIFGVEDPFKRATMGAEQYQKAMENITELTDKLGSGKVQTGTKKALDLGNIGKGAGTGAAVGAAIGTIIPGLGTAIGTAVGAAVGAIAGALSTKVVPVFESLKDVYGELFDPNTYELNPRLLADYEKLDADTRQIVDHWEEIREKAEQARNELKDNLADFSGNLGKQLEDMLVNAWTNRRLYSAVDEFQRYVGQQIASILEERAFSAIFEGLFTDIGKKMEESFLGPNADYDITDEMTELTKVLPQYLEAYGTVMDQMNEQMEEMGYGGLRQAQKNAQASSNSVQNISETTGSAIQGGVTALRISSEVRNERLSLMSANLDEMLRRQMLATTLAEDIRTIQVDSYLALVAIKNNTEGNLNAVLGIADNVSRIEKATRGLS